MLFHAVRWENDLVMCFNECGLPIPELQGVFAEVQARVLREATPQTSFALARWHHSGLAPIYTGRLVNAREWVAETCPRPGEFT